MAINTDAASAWKGSFEETLKALTRKRLQIKINRNRVQLLRRTQKRGYLFVSIHKGFMDAPQEVMHALIAWIEDRETASSRRILSEYMNSIEVDPPKAKPIISQGLYHNLQAIFDRLNAKYFHNVLSLTITWYTAPNKGKQGTYGQYDPHLRSVKINRWLDSPTFPEFFIEFVVYHEMLHAVVPPELDGGGRLIMHTPTFRRREREYEHYEKAIHWEEHGWA